MIVPRVEAEYRVVKTRDGKAIAGLSMGGSQSLEIGLDRAGKEGMGEFLPGLADSAPRLSLCNGQRLAAKQANCVSCAFRAGPAIRSWRRTEN